MKIQNKEIILFLLVVVPWVAKSQDYKIIAQVEGANELNIQWIPLNDSTWLNTRKFAFDLRRTTLSTIEVEIIAKGITPRGFSWFWNARATKNGLPLLMGRLLYGLDVVDSLENIQLNSIRYNYLFDEALRDPEMAVAIGFGFLDKNVEKQQRYKYEIILKKLNQESIVGSIVTKISDSLYLEVPANVTLEFYHPTGETLSSLANSYAGKQTFNVIAKSYGDSITLRWAPNSADFLSNSSKVGYILYRIEEEELKGAPVLTPILIDTLRPWSINRFTSNALNRDSLLNLVRQLLYEESKPIDASSELKHYEATQMRFMAALLSAERSALAAEALGLRYTDRNVQQGKKYVYILKSLATIFDLADAWIEVENLKEQKSSVIGFETDSLDHSVLLKWSKSNTSFSAFRIERSSDGGKSFELLTKTPLIFLESEVIENQSLSFTYLDSLEENYKPYTYRIQGLNAFAEWSEPVEVVGMGIDLTPPDIPIITFLEVKDGGAEIRWTNSGEDLEIKYYHLWKANDLIEEFKICVSNIPSNVSYYFYPGPISTDSSYYFALQAEDIHGNISAFHPYTLLVVDSIPPDTPKNASWSVDSSGIVTLTWDSGTERDLTGYRVFIANNPNHEFAELTIEPTAVNMWSDTISLKLLDKEVYYKIAAEDRNYNLSDFSEIIIVKRPDIIPPAAPASLPPAYTSNGMILNWNPSSSDDLSGYIIYRKMSESDLEPIVLIILKDPNAITYTDTSASMDVLYEYSIRAVDEAGLQSEPSFPVLARRPFDKNLLRIENFSVLKDSINGQVNLSWDFFAPANILNSNNFLFSIYESFDSYSWRKLRQVPAGKNQFSHKRALKDSEKIYYGIKAVLTDGQTSVLVMKGL